MDYIVKIGLFGFFVVAISYFIDIFIQYFSSYLNTLPFSGILCQFGVYTGLNLFLSIIVSAFFVKQLITFWK